MTGGDTPAYRDDSLPVERRVDDLVDRMTTEELVAQTLSVPGEYLGIESEEDEGGQLLDDDGNFDREAAEDLLEHGIGHLTRLAGGGGLEPERAAEITDEVQELLVEETRLGIPAVPHEECLSGYMGPGGTTFPQGIGLASTWNPALVEEMTTRIREQLLSIGTAHALSPVLDIGRDPRTASPRCIESSTPSMVIEPAPSSSRYTSSCESWVWSCSFPRQPASTSSTVTPRCSQSSASRRKCMPGARGSTSS